MEVSIEVGQIEGIQVCSNKMFEWITPKSFIRAPSLDDKADPNDSLMKMMKQMYDEGDDDMKRTIKKAWYESQTKKNDGGFPSMDDT